jgi:hypothetical protein
MIRSEVALVPRTLLERKKEPQREEKNDGAE